MCSLAGPIRISSKNIFVRNYNSDPIQVPTPCPTRTICAAICISRRSSILVQRYTYAHTTYNLHSRQAPSLQFTGGARTTLTHTPDTWDESGDTPTPYTIQSRSSPAGHPPYLPAVLHPTRIPVCSSQSNRHVYVRSRNRKLSNAALDRTVHGPKCDMIAFQQTPHYLPTERSASCLIMMGGARTALSASCTTPPNSQRNLHTHIHTHTHKIIHAHKLTHTQCCWCFCRA